MTALLRKGPGRPGLRHPGGKEGVESSDEIFSMARAVTAARWSADTRTASCRAVAALLMRADGGFITGSDYFWVDGASLADMSPQASRPTLPVESARSSSGVCWCFIFPHLDDV